MLRISYFPECLAISRTLHHPFQCSGNTTEKKKARIYVPEDGEEFCKVPSSRHDMAIVFMDPEQPWSPEQGLYATGPVNILPERRSQLSMRACQ